MIRLLLTLVAGLFVLGTAAVVYLALEESGETASALSAGLDVPASQDATPRTFHVGEGQSAAEIGLALERQGLIRSALLFRVMVRGRGVEDKLGRGDYELRANMTTSQIVDALLAGAVARGRIFTIPEGWRAAEIALRLEALGIATGDEFLSVVASPSRIAPFNQLVGDVPSLEGYLFPDTYEVDVKVRPEAVAERMVRQFDKQFNADLRREAKAHGLSVQQAVVLASIIEREAAVPQERSLISSVFHNRLRADMPLQADPTVQFAVANRDLRAAAVAGFWKKDLQQEDLALESPFNTYVVRGLPPSPISNPGLASLRAAVKPERTEYYYFVAGSDGRHAFAKTLDEHLLNVERLRSPATPR